MLKAGVDLSLRDPMNDTALHIAAMQNQLELIKILLDAGADINALGDAQRTPLLTALLHKRPAAGTRPLYSLICALTPPPR